MTASRWYASGDGKMICAIHPGVEWNRPYACPSCVPGMAQREDDAALDHDLKSALAEGLPTLRDHEQWCNELSKEARQLATTYATGDSGPSACGPAYLRVALSARIEAAKMADNRERRAWVLEVERARAKSGSRAPSQAPARPVPAVGSPSRTGAH